LSLHYSFIAARDVANRPRRANERQIMFLLAVFPVLMLGTVAFAFLTAQSEDKHSFSNGPAACCAARTAKQDQASLVKAA
jgi:hypothetical protein